MLKSSIIAQNIHRFTLTIRRNATRTIKLKDILWQENAILRVKAH